MKLQFWNQVGALMSNRPIAGVTQDLGEEDKFYGGRYFICETITRSASRILAEKFNAEYIEKEKP